MAMTTGTGRALWLRAFGFATVAFLVFPSVIVAIMSFSASPYLEFPPTDLSWRWYVALRDSPLWLDSAITSIQIGLISATVATLLGTAVAFAAKLRKAQSTALLTLFFTTPMTVPGVVLGIAIFIVYAPLGLNGTLTGIVLAHTMLALPFVVLTMTAALRHFDVSQFHAALSLGAGPVRSFILVVLPQMSGAMITSALFAFLTSFDEIVVTNFIGGGDNITLTQRMFNSLRQDLDPKIAAIGTTLTLLTIVILAAAVAVQGKKRLLDLFSNGKDNV